MADTALSFFTADRRPMKCTICGQTARPGAKLCSQCRAALKRARNETVSQLEPLPRSSRALATDRAAAKQRARNRAKARADARNPPVKIARDSALRRVWIAILVLGALVAVAVQFETRWFRAGESSEPGAPAIPAKADESVPVPPPTAVSPPPGRVEERGIAPTPPQQRMPAKGLEQKPASAGRSPRPTPVETVAASVPAVAAPVPASLTVPAPAPAPRETPPPDRWQVMNETIARCASEDFIGRVVCEQRARLQACDGFWGQVAQCPSGIANDHGQ